MAESLSLLEFLQALLRDAELRGSFTHDPQGTLDAHGLGALSPADVHDALVLVQDTQTIDYSPDHLAAVEHLNSYLADPDPQGVAAQTWSDPDDQPADANGLGGFSGSAEPGWLAEPAGSSFGGSFGLGDHTAPDATVPAADASAGDHAPWWTLPDAGDPYGDTGTPDADPADDLLTDEAPDVDTGGEESGSPDHAASPHHGDLPFP